MSRGQLRRGRGALRLGRDDTDSPILHVDMDAFYASVSLLERPELRGTPVIIGGWGSRGVVLSATYEARALGVHSAMPMGRARRLAPTATYLEPTFERYSEVSAGVMEIFGSITARVEPLGMDEAFLDVSGAQRRLGSPAAIGEMIRARVADEQGITSRSGWPRASSSPRWPPRAASPTDCSSSRPTRSWRSCIPCRWVRSGGWGTRPRNG